MGRRLFVLLDEKRLGGGHSMLSLTRRMLIGGNCALRDKKELRCGCCAFNCTGLTGGRCTLRDWEEVVVSSIR